MLMNQFFKCFFLPQDVIYVESRNIYKRYIFFFRWLIYLAWSLKHGGFRVLFKKENESSSGLKMIKIA